MNVVPIELDKPRQLRYTWGSIKRLRDTENIILDDLEDDELGDLGVLSSVLWAGLVWEDKDLEVMDVADMVDLNRTQEVVELVIQAMKQGKEPSDPSEATA